MYVCMYVLYVCGKSSLKLLETGIVEQIFSCCKVFSSEVYNVRRVEKACEEFTECVARLLQAFDQ